MTDKFEVGDMVYASDWCYGEIVRINGYTADVEFETTNGGGTRIDKEVLDLINRYEEKNTELLEKIKKLQDEYRWLDQESDILAADVNALNHFLETAKAEAYKECIEKVEAYYRETRFAYDAECLCEELDDILNGLVGEQNAQN